MSITNRLSLFFLTALGLVLGGFSLTLYLLANRHLHTQTDHRLDAAMHTLVAAIEIHPSDVEWEPLERRVVIGEDPALDQIRWAAHDLGGRLVDCSLNLELLEGQQVTRNAQGWRVRVHRVRAGKFESEQVEDREESVSGKLAGCFGSAQLPGSVSLPKDRTYKGDGLILTVVVSDAPTVATLWHLGSTMAVMSAAIWLSAAIWGRWLCRRALHPILQMATSARAIRQHPAQGAFLDVPPTRDELEDLGCAFNELLAGLRESLERQSRFTGDASHQLRTPLTAMIGQVDVALRKERSPEEYQRVLTVLRRRSDQLHQIIESLLFLARADAAAPLPDTRSFHLGDWCRAWLDNWDQHLRRADIALRIETVAKVHTQPALLGQIIDNLIDNACKYSEPGTPITLTVTVEADQAVLTVADQGCGLTPEEAALVFQPFYRGRQARWLGKPGAGLGLTVVQRLVAMIGGKVSVLSELGKGCRFKVSLPFESDDETLKRDASPSGQSRHQADEAA